MALGAVAVVPGAVAMVLRADVTALGAVVTALGAVLAYCVAGQHTSPVCALFGPRNEWGIPGWIVIVCVFE